MFSPRPSSFRVLIVEDDYFIADDLRRSFEKVGVDVAGPVGNIQAALALLDKTPDVNAAVLDVNLDIDGKVFPLAEILQARGIPFVFATGYSGTELPDEFAFVRRFEKPCNAAHMLQALRSMGET